MTVLPLVIAPDPLLQTKSKPVEQVDDALRKFMDDMVQTMYAQGGIGLAAVQVGQLKRVLVMDVDYEVVAEPKDCSCCIPEIKNDNPIYIVNPVIEEESSDINTYKEGCLSFPGTRANVDRPESVRVKYLDYNGKEQVVNMDGIKATCVQHEIDHLNGVTFIDHISKLKRDVILKKIKKYKR